MLPIRFVASPGDLDGKKVVTVDGSFGPSPEAGLHLAHWPGNRTPDALRRDLSTEIAFAFQDLEEAERARLAAGCTALAINHYDTDGLCALFALSEPERAAKHRELLVDVAASGDLFEVRSTRAFAIDAALRNLADPERSSAAASLADQPGIERKQSLVEAGLRLLGDLLDDEDAAPELWRDDVEALEADRRDLEGALFDDLVYLDLGVWTGPRGRASSRASATQFFDPGRHAFLGSGRHDRALVLGPTEAGATARLVLGTRSFFDVVSRTPSARPDLAALTARLNELEGRRGGGDAWRHQALAGASPELWFGSESLPLYAEHAGAALAPSRLDAEEIKRVVLDAIRDAWELPDDDDEAEDGEDIFAV
ncbi:MAG: DUF6687 family protein [Planctomycetota bacterium]